MSSKIKKNSISLTRGDTFRAKVGILLEDGTPYIPSAEDSLRFALKHPQLNNDGTDYADKNPLILKTIPTDTMILQLDPADTKSLGFGDYVYDIEITLEDGTVDTFITSAPFKLTEEVH